MICVLDGRNPRTSQRGLTLVLGMGYEIADVNGNIRIVRGGNRNMGVACFRKQCFNEPFRMEIATSKCWVIGNGFAWAWDMGLGF